MRIFPATLVSLVFVGSKSEDSAPSESPSMMDSLSPAFPVSTLHFYVINRLNSVFGEENCFERTEEETAGIGYASLDAATGGYSCTIFVPGFSAYANYLWKYRDSTESPIYLAVSYGYDNGSSGLVDIDFSNDGCGMECEVESYFTAILDNTSSNNPPNNTDSNGLSVKPTAIATQDPVNLPDNLTKAPTTVPTVSPLVPTNIPTVEPMVSATVAPVLANMVTMMVLLGCPIVSIAQR